jgi:hypothetical protein
MAGSIYTDKLIIPDERLLADDLGETKPYLDSICSFIEDEYGDMKPEWKFYSKKSGWILKLLNKKRNIVFIVPCATYFRAAFTFGDKASELVIQSELPESIKHALAEAKKYAEGRTIQTEVRSAADLETVLTLIRIKLSS